MIVAEFKDINDKFRARCTHYLLMLFDTSKNSFKEHLDKSSECSLVLQFKTTRFETSKDIKRVELKVLKVVKSTFVAANIDFFDATLLCDIQKFNLFCEIANFVQQLRQCQHQYRESDLLNLLFDCLRDFALIWYKQQCEIEIEIVKKSLSEWLEVLIIAFSAKSSSKIETSFVSSVILSSQYHSCVQCFAFFSSLTRLLQHTQIVCQKVVCKQCEKAFEFNNKFHEHDRQHHTTKKIVKDVSRRSFNREKDKSTIFTQTSTTSSTTLKTTSKISIFRFVTSSEQTRNSSISLAIFVATSRQIISSKRSRLSLSTYKITSKRVKITSKFASHCLFIFSTTFTSMFRKLQKSHFTIDDLIRMFVEKSKSFDLSQHQNRRSSSRNFDARQSYQSRIIFYFKSAINQKTSIF